MERETRQAIRNGFGIEYDVRKMTDEEIDENDTYHWWCNDESGIIFKESELTFIE